MNAMAYTLEQAALVAQQLERLSTLNPHQLIGQFESLEFWLREASHAIAVIDDYPARFERLRAAQERWVDAHETAVFGVECPHCGGGPCELPAGRPPPPRRISSSDLSSARQSVKDAGYRLLRRMYRAGWIDEATLRAGCDQLGTSIDLDDLGRA